MNHRDISDKLVLVYDERNGKALGTGFIVNELGHFITSYHVVKDSGSIKDNIRCAWKGDTYRVRYIQQLADKGFYGALRHGKFAIDLIDLIILEILIPNKSFETEHLPALSFDMNEQLPKSVKVSFSGFSCEKFLKKEEAELSRVTATLTKYQKKNGLWLFAGEGDMWQGYSGSPVFHPQLGEVMGVVVRRSIEDKQSGAVQSLHMLSNKLKSYGCDCERFFRSPFSLYGKYHKRKCRSFEEEEEGWPYAIDKKEFVDAFDFKTGRFPLKKQWSSKKSKKCVPFIIEQLKEHPVFCVGYYGMGKTTISKFLFTEYSSYSKQEYPVFIPLGPERLSALNLDNWDDFLARKICQDFKRSAVAGADGNMEDGLMRQYFKHFAKHNKIALIFDGIDEALCDRTSLGEFAEVLKSLSCTYFLTSRNEFYAFFDVFESHMANQPNLVVELMPWREKQWQKYIENLYEKCPNKSGGIKALRKALERHEYGTLPERPLFLKMISDLELGNKTELDVIPAELKSNRAAVYYVYVRWKILDDYERKRGVQSVDKTSFRKESFRLFRELADIEYKKSVPKGGAAELLGCDLHDRGSYTYSGFTMDDIQNVCARFTALNRDFINTHLLESSFFSMIRRDIREENGGEIRELFRFSHKSFCEYLVAYNLANSIFCGTVEDAKCGLAWSFYQTCEVSAHFGDEVRRVCCVKRLTEEAEKPYLQSAFEKVLLAECDMRDYSERFEEVLYYTGKFGIDSSKIFDLLERIVSDPKRVHTIYYRTAHISLSMSKDVEYCLKYIEYLVESFNSSKEAFKWNTGIQINYYGKANLHAALKEDIDRFINEGKLEGIIPLEIFSYFTCIPFDATEMSSAREYLDQIRRVCDERGHIRLKRIVDDTLPILECVSGVN